MRILAALSGGVDSAVAASRLVRDGAEVVAVHLSTGVEADGVGGGGARSCCGADDARDARRVAEALRIPFYVVDVRQAFRLVLDDFVAGYARGTTPNPCVLCNRHVKFGRLLEIATDLGCEGVATGHYARTARAPDGRMRLLRSADARKDQTYVLHALDQTQLARARFPLGDLKKPEVRDEARRLGLGVADKPDSQELCFVPDGDYRTYLRRHARDVLVPGGVFDADGREIGSHEGAAGYTVGQRRGLPAVGAPRYVTAVDAPAGRVHVAPRDALMAREVGTAGLNWIERAEPETGRRIRVRARIRHAAPLADAAVETLGGGSARVTFDQPVFAPAPGQALVAYVEDAVLCGGTIRSSAAGTPAALDRAEHA